MTTRFANRMKLVKPSAIREFLRFGADPSIISFAGGYPDATLFPLEELDEVFTRSILEHGRDTLQYTVSDGPAHLRAQIAARMANEGVTCTMDNILVLHKGVVRESGTHQELLAARGIYFKLFELQYQKSEAVLSNAGDDVEIRR